MLLEFLAQDEVLQERVCDISHELGVEIHQETLKHTIK